MGKFTLTIQTDNAAFEDDPVPELVRILKETAAQMHMMNDFNGTIRDINGNPVGTYRHTGK
jgi:hypothetical protein